MRKGAKQQFALRFLGHTGAPEHWGGAEEHTETNLVAIANNSLIFGHLHESDCHSASMLLFHKNLLNPACP